MTHTPRPLGQEPGGDGLGRARLVRVSKSAPCPKCGRIKFCSVAADGSIAICMRDEHGAIKTTRNGGYLHILQPGNGTRHTICMPPLRIARDFSPQVESLLQTTGEESVAALAQMLGLRDSAPLRHLRTLWNPAARAWGFPMFNAHGATVGIRYRNAAGEKWAAKGSQNGLFVPTGALKRPGTLFLPEGPTSTAAILQLGLRAIGRAWAQMPSTHLLPVCRDLDIVVVADPDKAGRTGSRDLAQSLLLVARSVRIIEPPPGSGDVRDWVTQHNATTAEVEAIAAATPPLQLRMASLSHG